MNPTRQFVFNEGLPELTFSVLRPGHSNIFEFEKVSNRFVIIIFLNKSIRILLLTLSFDKRTIFG